MVDLLLSKLNQLPKYIWIFFGISSVTTPLGICYMFINSGNLVYKTPEVEINFQGKDKANKLTNNTEYSNKSLKVKLEKLESNITKLQSNKNPETIKEVKNSFEELKPTAEQVLESSGQLTEFVESAIDEQQ